MDPSGIPMVILLSFLLGVASVTDIRSRKIPNLLTYPAMLTGMVYHAVTKGFPGLLFSAEGLFLGISLLIVFYFMGGMGAGDVKLLGAVGAVIGPKGVFTAFLFTALIGGLYAGVLLALSGHLAETAKRYGTMLKTYILTRKIYYIAPERRDGKMPVLCYGVVIAAGTLCSVLLPFP